MTKKKTTTNQQRRDFLRGSAIASVGAVVATGTPAALASTDESVTEVTTEEGYRLTQHILDYYKTAAS